MTGEGVYELAGDDIAIWLDERGSIMLKIREPFGDSVERRSVAEHETRDLAAVLERLAQVK
jgi:hypothetical protein